MELLKCTTNVKVYLKIIMDKLNDDYDCLKKIEDNLASHYSTKVKLSHNKKGFGNITFEYYSIEELNSILDKMNVQVN